MSAVGFDVGNESCVVAVVARNRQIEIVLNSESKRETPSIVSFGDHQRFIGTPPAGSHPSISHIKRLIGRRFSDPELQHDLLSLPFHITEAPDGFPLIHARYRSEQRSFTPTQLLAMILSNLKGIAETGVDCAVVDCCIGIPIYFTDLQRRAMLDAATIAGLHPLRLIHETTAIALSYGIYKLDLPENDQVNVAFIDIGHTSMQVCIAGFKKGQMKILAQSYDRSLGGRDFDEALVKHFAAEFEEKYRIDVYSNTRASHRLRTACEKLKKELSGNWKAALNIDCLVDAQDVRGFINKLQFEHISGSILERVRGPLKEALADAGLAVENIHSVEVVGSGSLIPAITRTLTEFFGKEPRRPMNDIECVARGSAIQCAILSPTFKMRDFQVLEVFPFSISLAWESPESQNAISDGQQTVIVFPKGNSIPSIKALTFYRSSTFSVDILYENASDLQTLPKISTYTIGPFQSSSGERAKLKVKVRLNLHGIVSVEAANMMEEVGVQMDTGAKTMVKKINIPVVELVYGAMMPSHLQQAVKGEFLMALQDKVIEESTGKKDAMDGNVDDMRTKLQEVCTIDESSSFEQSPLQQEEREEGSGSLKKVNCPVIFEENMEDFDVEISSSSASWASKITAPSQSSGPVRKIRNRDHISKLAFEGLLRGLIASNAVPTWNEFSEMMNASNNILEQLGSGDLFEKWHPNMLSVEVLLSEMEDIEAEGDLTVAETPLKERLLNVGKAREASNAQLQAANESEAHASSIVASHGEYLSKMESSLEALRMEIMQLEERRDELKKKILVDRVVVDGFRRQKEVIVEDLQKLGEDEAAVQRDIKGLHSRDHYRQKRLQELRSIILDRLSSVDNFLLDLS